MFCKHCGTNLPDGVKFCPSCGKPTGVAAGVSGSASGSASGPIPGPMPGPKPNIPVNNGALPYGFNKPKAKIKKTFNIGNFILWGGCAVAILSLFLPYCSASLFGFSKSIALMDVETGMYFLGIVAIIAVLNIFKLNILCIIGSVFNLILAFYGHSYIQEEVGGLVNFEIGNTLLYLGGFVMLGGSIAALVLWMQRKKAA